MKHLPAAVFSLIGIAALTLGATGQARESGVRLALNALAAAETGAQENRGSVTPQASPTPSPSPTPTPSPTPSPLPSPSPSEQDPRISGELGARTNPVRCEMPRGQRAYLNRLRCPAGDAPTYHRVGNFGFGPYGTIIDGYSVRCRDGRETTIFMDMYHRGHIERRSVRGFTIVEAEEKSDGPSRIARRFNIGRAQIRSR